MGKTEIKSPVACRITSDLRQQLAIEAAEEGQSLSSYMELLLLTRHDAVNVAALVAENAQLKEASKAVQIQQDNEHILALRTQLAESEKWYQDLSQRHASITTERDEATDAEAEMFGKLTEQCERTEALEAENTQLKAASKAIQVQQNNERILALKTQLAQTERQYQDLSQRHTSLARERDALAKVPTNTLPKWWSPEHYNLTIPYMKELSSKHPDYSPEQLLPSAVAVAAANEENSFFVYTLKDFWRKNPHFLNLQTPVVTR
jgi:myosin heavy subunit